MLHLDIVGSKVHSGGILVQSPEEKLSIFQKNALLLRTWKPQYPTKYADKVWAPASTTELQVLLLSASKRQLASRTQRLAGTAVVYLTDRGHGCALGNPRHLCSSTSTLSQTSLCTTSGPAVRRGRSTRGTCQGGIQSLSRWPAQAGIVMRSCKDGLRQQCASAVEYMCATQTAALAATWPGQCLLPIRGAMLPDSQKPYR